MVQSRVIAGRNMEKYVLRDGWVKSSTRPILKWRGEGRNNIEKIINSNYNPKEFSILENINLNKYDIYNPTTKKKREVKSYYISQVNNWILYSEPYFKISTRSQLNKIGPEVYNDFLERFYAHANNSGLFKFIQEQMISSNEGIVFKDGFIPKEQLEFRTIIQKKQWKGYNRIQIQFKLIG
jgi:hypothetical protein